jgi:hypothetical protein
MPIAKFQLPDGRVARFEVPEGTTSEQATQMMSQYFAKQQPAQPERKPGIIESGIGGAKKLLSSQRTALESPFGTEEAAQAGLARARALEEKTPSQLSLEKVKEKYAKEGFFPAAGEVLSQAPNFIMEQLPQLGTAFAGGRLGAIAGAPLGPGGAFVGGIAGALTPLALQAYGAGAERRAAEGLPQDPGKTALSAAGQAGLETVAMVVPFGGKLMSRILGIAEKEGAQALASPAARKLAEERLATSIAKGTGKGLLAEIPTEVGQQMLERWQANMPLMDDNALKEYSEAAYGASLFGAPFGGVGRRAQVGQAREQVTRADALEAAEQAKKLREAEAAEKAKPEYALRIGDQFETLQQQEKALLAARGKKLGKDATDEQKDVFAQQTEKLQTLRNELKALAPDYKEIKAKLPGLREERRIAGMSEQDYYYEQMGMKPDAQIAAEKAAKEKAAPPKDEMQDWMDQTAAQAAAVPKPQLQKELDTALDGLRHWNSVTPADVANVLSDNPLLLQKVYSGELSVPEFNAKQNRELNDALKLQVKDLASQMAQGRVAAGKTSAQIEEEKAALQRISEAPTSESKAATQLGLLKELEGYAGEMKPGVAVEPGLQKQNYRFKAREFQETADDALTKIQESLDKIAKGETLDSSRPDARKFASATSDILRQQTLEAKPEYIDAVMNRVANERAAEGQQPITTDQAAKAAVQMNAALDAFINGQATEEALLRQLDVLRARLLVARPEVQKQGLPTEGPLSAQSNYREAQRVTEERGETAQTLEGQLRRQRDYVGGLLERVVPTGTIPRNTRELLQQTQTAIEDGTATREVLDLAEDIAGRVQRGQNTQAELPKLNDALRSMQQAQAPGIEGGQQSLFGTEDLGVVRATAANFRKFLNSKQVQALRALLPKVEAVVEKERTVRTGETSPGVDAEFYAKRIDSLEARINEAKDSLKDLGGASWESIMETRAVLPEEVRVARQKLVALLQEQNKLEMEREAALKPKLKSNRAPYAAAQAETKAAKLKDQIKNKEISILQSIRDLAIQIREQRGQALYGPIIQKFEQQAQMFEARLAELEDAMPEGGRMSPDLDALFTEAEDLKEEIAKARAAVKEARDRQERTEDNSGLLAAADERIVKDKARLAELEKKLANVDFIGEERRAAQVEAGRLRRDTAVAGSKLREVQELQSRQTEERKRRIATGEGMQKLTRTVVPVERTTPSGKRIVMKEKGTGLPVQQKKTTGAFTERTPAKGVDWKSTKESKPRIAPTAEAVEEATPKAQRVGAAENLKDIAKTAGTLARQANVTDISPKPKRAEPLRVGSQEAKEEKVTQKQTAAQRRKLARDLAEGVVSEDDDAGLAFRGGEPSAQDTKTKTLIVDILSTRLSTQERETLAEHYGEPVNSAGFLAKVREDIVKFTVKGAQSVAASIRNIIRKLQAAIVGAAIILNPSYIGPGYQVAIPQNVTTFEQVLAKVPESVRTKMSSGAQQAYANIMPAIQADLKKNNKLFILTDKPNARVFVFDSNGQPILDKKVLLGLQTGDYYKGNTDVKANRFTPAGLFTMGLRDATRSKGEAVTAGDYDFGKVFVLDKAIDGKYSITLFHSVYTKMSDAQARQKALAKDSAEDSRYSFGCINVDKETYKYLLDNYETQMDGAKLFIVPDTPNATMDFVRGKATTAGDITRQAAPEVTRKVTKTIPGTPSTASSRMELAARKEEVIRPGDSGMVFRTGEDSDTVVDAAKARALIATTLSNLPKGVNLVYSPTLAGIKPDILERLVAGGYEEGTSFKGVVLSDGTIVVVGDQHSSVADLEATLFHEMVGHYGVDTVIGMDRLQQYANKTDVIKLAETLGGAPLVREAVAAAALAKKQKFSPEVQKLQALREIIAYTAEKRITENFRQKASRWLKEFVGMMRASLRQMGFENAARLSTSDVYYAIKLANKAFNDRTVGPYRAKGGMMAFRSKREGSRYGGSFVGSQKGVVDNLRGNFLGLSGRVQFVDQYAALDAAMKKGLDAGVISDLEAEQAGYYLRFGQQANAFATQALTNGPLSLVKQVTKRGMEFVYKSAPGASMVKVAQALEKSGIKNSTELEHMFTIYTAGKRAKQVGWNKLNFDNPASVEQDYNRLMEELKGNDKARAAFEEAAKVYKEYNNGLVDFLVQTGYMSASRAAELKAIDYVPFYRVQGGELQLMVDKERPIRIANMKDEPMLHELVGDNSQILPIFTSSAQNAFVLTRMGLRNQMMKDNVMLLGRLGIASKIGKGAGPQGPNTVRYKVKGEDNFAVIDSDMYGIPAELIVKGMEGIKTTIPMAIKIMGMPADVLRKFVTRNPAYAVRQAIRDPLTAWFTTGVDGVPVLNSMKELGKMVAGRSKEEAELMQAGAISSNVMTGDEQDMAKALRDMSLGRSGWTKLMMKADALAMQGDAATRAVIYKDSLNKGMSEMQAFMRTLESMNFSRRGLSPSMQMMSTVIPFFNAQIQGLDVLYRAFKGQMPYSEQLKIRQKLYTRGLLLAAGTLAYAAAMEDDEAYKRAKPEERLGNWFVYTPFSDEPMKVPIPFEFGYLFKSLFEALYNTAAEDERNQDIIKGMSKLVALSNPFALPAAIKPATEVILGRSFFGGDIESKRELTTMMPGERYRDSTTEFAKMLGSVTGDAGLTPIKIDYLIRGYTGALGVAIASLANPILNTEASAVEKPTMKTSKMPFIGGLFQPVEGRGTLDAAYERILEVEQAQGTYKRLAESGKKAEAQEFLDKYRNKLTSASLSGEVRQQLGELSKIKRQVLESNRTTAEKDALLEKIDDRQYRLAQRFLSVTGETRPQ